MFTAPVLKDSPGKCERERCKAISERTHTTHRGTSGSFPDNWFNRMGNNHEIPETWIRLLFREFRRLIPETTRKLPNYCYHNEAEFVVNRLCN